MRTLFLAPQTSKQALLYPLAGWLTGGIAAAVFWAGQFLFPNELAVLVSLLVSVWLSRARAEASFTTVISQSGSPGSSLTANGIVALTGLLAIKLVTLHTMLTVRVFSWDMALQLLVVHSLSRFLALTLPSPNRITELSGANLVVAGLLALVPLIGLVLYSGLWIYGLFLLPLSGVRFGIARWYRRLPAGADPVTGIGAAQQIAEAFLYISFVSFLWVSV
nr:hypothetical protein [uncultured Arsenicibacter sp.]